MTKMTRERILLGLAAVSLVAGGLLPAVAMPLAGSVLRWVAVVVLCAFALGRRSLTPWIFVAMVAGAEIGFDAPRFAVGLRMFSDIFLRLIKTIVAPLILATLI